MNCRTQLLCLQVLLGVLTIFAVASTGGQASRPVSWEHYRVLTERNIFVRNRRQQRESQTASEQPAGVINTDRYLVLTGIGHCGSEGIAFVEDTRSVETIRKRTGEHVGNGRLVKITLDYVEYECKGNTIRIEIGGNLAGSTVRRMSTETATSTKPAAPADAGGSVNTPKTNTAAILERMRRRREQETNR